MLDSIVKKLLLKHKGGEEFFDNLDKEIQKHISIVEQLLYMVCNSKSRGVIMSGSFGRFLRNYIETERYWLGVTLIVNGSLRKGEPIDDLEYLKHKINGKSFDFIDDSYYSGKTFNVVKSEIERLGGKMNNVYVVYDGSKNKDDRVHSLYRYHS